MQNPPEGLSAEAYSAAVQAVANWESSQGEQIGALIVELFEIMRADIAAMNTEPDINTVVDTILRERYGLLPSVRE